MRVAREGAVVVARCVSSLQPKTINTKTCNNSLKSNSVNLGLN